MKVPSVDSAPNQMVGNADRPYPVDYSLELSQIVRIQCVSGPYGQADPMQGQRVAVDHPSQSWTRLKGFARSLRAKKILGNDFDEVTRGIPRESRSEFLLVKATDP